jgi:hypothetical protein
MSSQKESLNSNNEDPLSRKKGNEWKRLSVLILLTLFILFFMVVEMRMENDDLMEKIGEQNTEIGELKQDIRDFAPDEELKILRTIRKYFPDNFRQMEKIAYCESGMKTGIVSSSGDWGLFQINQVWLREIDSKKMLDLEENVKMARKIFDIQGYKAWAWSEHCWGK